jgi:hypothetical protein
MECIYCGHELIWCDSYGRGYRESYYGTAANGIHYPSTYEHIGDIYKCKNHEGFSTEEEVIQYLTDNNLSFDDLGVSCWEEVVCDSAYHRVSGSFYTDEYDNLKEGYPC